MSVHRHVQWRRDPDGTAYRARRSFPAGPPNATVLLAGPESVSDLDGEGRDHELVERLTARLVASGTQVLQCDMPARDTDSPVSADDERTRAERLRSLLDGYRHLMTASLSLVGFSLGGQALLRLLETGVPPRADRAVLIGTVVETDAFLTSRIALIELVYGSFDLVGYLAGEPVDRLPPAVFEPAVYADWSARHLIGPHSPAVRVHVLEGLGHTLHPCGPGPVRDPLRALATLVGVTS